MSKPHKHAELIKAWADGEMIEWSSDGECWCSVNNPSWYEDCYYRIKPEPKPDVVKYMGLNSFGTCNIQDLLFMVEHCPHQLKLTFDGETGKLKSAEVINND